MYLRHKVYWSTNGYVVLLTQIVSSTCREGGEVVRIPSCRMSATVFVQPLDLVKNRMQLSGKKSAVVCAIAGGKCGLAPR